MLPTGVRTVLSWLPYELFDELFDGSYTDQTIPEYEMFMQTRTVTMFVYMKNDADQPVYYGSTNCVHTNVEQIARVFLGGQLHSEIENQYALAYAEYYNTFPDYCIPADATGYAVTPMHSFVQEVTVRVDNGNVLSIDVPTYEMLSQSIR